MNNTTKGFTLIELLVVISIIGVLSSTVFATVNTSNEKARDSLRSEQIRQVINAFKLYELDKGTLPGADIGLTGGNYCLGLNDGNACWGQGNFIAGPHYPTEPVGYAAAYGNTALNSALRPYMTVVPKDPLGTHDYGDYYMYRFANGQNTLHWVIESCSPDVVPPVNGSAVSQVSCKGGTISKLPLWYGYGCQYQCVLDLQK